jgi:hypothetical protein
MKLTQNNGNYKLKHTVTLLKHLQTNSTVIANANFNLTLRVTL